jgi:YggT family protein
LILVSSLFALVIYLLKLFLWAVVLSWIVSLLISFGVLDTRNRLVWSISDFLYRVTDPVIRPVRNVLPTLGGIDFSPMVVLLVIQFILIPLVIQIEVSTGVIAY